MPFFHSALFTLTLTFALLSNLSVAQTATIPTAIATAQPTSTQILKAPICAESCITSVTEAQACAVADEQCCRKSSSIQNAISVCLDSSTCSQSDKASAITFYSSSCALTGFSTTSASVVSATGAAPSKVTHSGGSSLVLTATGADSTSAIISDTWNYNQGLQLPAILGIVLAVIIMATAVSASLLWACLRRRQVRRGGRIDLDAEFGAPIARPPRSRSVKSTFMVQPSPTEKQSSDFGGALSRSSTLVAPPPPIAKLDKALPEIRMSALHTDEKAGARQEALNTLLGTEGETRPSLDSNRSGTSKTSLMVEPLNIKKGDEYDEANKI